MQTFTQVPRSPIFSLPVTDGRNLQLREPSSAELGVAASILADSSRDDGRYTKLGKEGAAKLGVTAIIEAESSRNAGRYPKLSGVAAVRFAPWRRRGQVNDTCVCKSARIHAIAHKGDTLRHPQVRSGMPRPSCPCAAAASRPILHTEMTYNTVRPGARHPQTSAPCSPRTPAHGFAALDSYTEFQQ